MAGDHAKWIRAYRRVQDDKISLLSRHNFEIQSPELAFSGDPISVPRIASYTRRVLRHLTVALFCRDLVSSIVNLTRQLAVSRSVPFGAALPDAARHATRRLRSRQQDPLAPTDRTERSSHAAQMNVLHCTLSSRVSPHPNGLMGVHTGALRRSLKW